MDLLKRTYLQFVNSDEYSDLDETPEVINAYDEFTELTKHFDRRDFIEFEEVATKIAATNEMQGFCRGFKYAMQLQFECRAKDTEKERVAV